MADLQGAFVRELELQHAWTSQNTPEMRERGILVRNTIPDLLLPLCEAHRTAIPDLSAEGRDGTGRKTRVPWVRLHSQERSPSATEGWYAVYLFSATGDAVYLSLNQGTTQFESGVFARRPMDELKQRVERARSILGQAVHEPEFSTSMELKDPRSLGEGYEAGNVACIRYAAKAIPDDGTLKKDAARFLEYLKVLYDSEQPPRQPNAFLIGWNPKRWTWSELPKMAASVEQGVQPRTSDMRESWSISHHTNDIKPGDQLFLIRLGVPDNGLIGSGLAASLPYEDDHWDGTPNKKAWYVKIEWARLLDPGRHAPLSIESLKKEMPDVHWTPQANGNQVPAEHVPTLNALWNKYFASLGKPASYPIAAPAASYGLEDALADVFDKAAVRAAYELIRQRKSVVLQGPPGVGKTFVAKRLAMALVETKDTKRIAWTQFHQSYSYEDFVEGFRPAPAGGFELRKGIFATFCDFARQDSTSQYVFVIDEINRGNLSRIFGEVLSLLEDDKRERHEVLLAYSHKPFTIPANLLVLGLMNTADRSLAVVDFALRRRFRFVDLEPQFGNPEFSAYLSQKGVSGELIKNLIARMQQLNGLIREDDRHLGKGFEIGHSYFTPAQAVPSESDWYQSIIEYEIKPLLREYWIENRSKAEELGSALSEK